MNSPKHIYKIAENLANIRLDKALNELSELSRSRIKKLIESDSVQINAQTITSASYIVKLDDEIILTIPEAKPSQMSAYDFALDIIYEDDDLIVINKPAGLTVHPGAGNHNDTLVNALLHHYQDNLSQIGGVLRPGIVHRLDKDTSGVMLVAKSDEVHIALSQQLKGRDIKRIYQAIIWGMPVKTSDQIRTNIGRKRSDRTKMTVLQYGGKEAVTDYKVTEILAGGKFSIVECQLQTGRTHQIRVHMSHVKHSIFGDQTYGHNSRKISNIMLDDADKEFLRQFQRQALHAKEISFTHPISGEMMNFTAALPADMQTLITKIKKFK